jgi:hypothetical protein
MACAWGSEKTVCGIELIVPRKHSRKNAKKRWLSSMALTLLVTANRGGLSSKWKTGIFTTKYAKDTEAEEGFVLAVTRIFTTKDTKDTKAGEALEPIAMAPLFLSAQTTHKLSNERLRAN